MFGWGFQFSENRGKRNRQGFTLVELLVVIGIISVLIAVLVPVLTKARAAANRTVCQSNIRQLGMGILMYCNYNRGWFPTCAYADDGIAYKQYPDDWIYWEANRSLDDSAIAKYVAKGQALKNLLRCPIDGVETHKTLLGIVSGQGPYSYSYSMNDGLAENVRSGQYRTNLTHWRAPSRKIMLTEAWERYPTAGWDYAVPITQRHGSGMFHGTAPGNPILASGAILGSRASAYFLDGHSDVIDQDFAFNEFQVRPEAQ